MLIYFGSFQAIMFTKRNDRFTVIRPFSFRLIYKKIISRGGNKWTNKTQNNSLHEYLLSLLWDTFSFWQADAGTILEILCCHQSLCAKKNYKRCHFSHANKCSKANRRVKEMSIKHRLYAYTVLRRRQISQHKWKHLCGCIDN